MKTRMESEYRSDLLAFSPKTPAVKKKNLAPLHISFSFANARSLSKTSINKSKDQSTERTDGS